MSLCFLLAFLFFIASLSDWINGIYGYLLAALFLNVGVIAALPRLRRWVYANKGDDGR